ncbi:hypothetical protein D1007_08670 [Hordeum vulgare]|nr:hypothetical protein D1007_08670 [Hordeum vulgare]
MYRAVPADQGINVGLSLNDIARAYEKKNAHARRAGLNVVKVDKQVLAKRAIQEQGVQQANAKRSTVGSSGNISTVSRTVVCNPELQHRNRTNLSVEVAEGSQSDGLVFPDGRGVGTLDVAQRSSISSIGGRIFTDLRHENKGEACEENNRGHASPCQEQRLQQIGYTGDNLKMMRQGPFKGSPLAFIMRGPSGGSPMAFKIVDEISNARRMSPRCAEECRHEERKDFTGSTTDESNNCMIPLDTLKGKEPADEQEVYRDGYCDIKNVEVEGVQVIGFTGTRESNNNSIPEDDRIAGGNNVREVVMDWTSSSGGAPAADKQASCSSFVRNELIPGHERDDISSDNDDDPNGDTLDSIDAGKATQEEKEMDDMFKGSAYPSIEEVTQAREPEDGLHFKTRDDAFFFFCTFARKVLQKARLEPRKIMQIFTSMGKTRREIMFDTIDISNIACQDRARQRNIDIEDTMNLFAEMQRKRAGFHHVEEIDGNNVVRSLFWTDSLCKMNYGLYGGFVSFDTTFSTNIYGLPFAPIIGVDNHGSSVLFGIVLLKDEMIGSFKWLLSTFVEAMGGREPKFIITDQDKAMKAAIEQALPNTRHRFCLWHIRKNMKENNATVFAQHPGMSDELHLIIKNSLNADEFEGSWKRAISKYKAEGNRHLNALWDLRTFWVPTYFKDCFYPFSSTTTRSESTNSMWRTYVNHKDTITMFVGAYNIIQQNCLATLDKIRHRTEEKVPSRETGFPIEIEASEIYTNEIFRKFQLELRNRTYYKCHDLGKGRQYLLKSISSQDKYRKPYPGEEFDRSEFRVDVDEHKEIYRCSCKKMTRDGIQCCHVLKDSRGEDESTGGEKGKINEMADNTNDSIENIERRRRMHSYPGAKTVNTIINANNATDNASYHTDNRA